MAGCRSPQKTSWRRLWWSPIGQSCRSRALCRSPAARTFIRSCRGRSIAGSERGKEARWYAETVLFARAASRQPLTRNAILSYPVSALAETNPSRADILHEYFIPPERFAEFLTACREIIPPARQDLIIITLRHVEADRVSVLAYAPSARIAAVMSFSQEISLDADRAMAALTERLIEAVIAL